MRISTSMALPVINELAEVLKNEFSSQHQYKLFGLGDKSLMVRESTFVGVQISLNQDSITVQGAPPTLAGGIFSGLVTTELAVVILPVFMLFGATPLKFKKLEREIAAFLHKKYN